VQPGCMLAVAWLAIRINAVPFEKMPSVTRTAFASLPIPRFPAAAFFPFRAVSE
jgi:hypothetical protein